MPAGYLESRDLEKLIAKAGLAPETAALRLINGLKSGLVRAQARVAHVYDHAGTRHERSNANIPLSLWTVTGSQSPLSEHFCRVDKLGGVHREIGASWKIPAAFDTIELFRLSFHEKEVCRQLGIPQPPPSNKGGKRRTAKKKAIDDCIEWLKNEFSRDTARLLTRGDFQEMAKKKAFAPDLTGRGFGRAWAVAVQSDPRRAKAGRPKEGAPGKSAH